MKEIVKELISEKGKELTAIGIALLLIAAGTIAVYLHTQGGAPFVPEEVASARSRINFSLSRGITATDDLTENLNSLLELQKEGRNAQIIAQIPIYKADLRRIEEALVNMPGDIQIVADNIDQVRPRNAGKALSEAMNAAAQASIELLRLREDMAALYDELDANARGEGGGEFNLIVNRVNRQGSLINSLQDEFRAKIAQFRELTNVDNG